jgi:acetyltransferase-like isoleucine patch superfamily enzyme
MSDNAVADPSRHSIADSATIDDSVVLHGHVSIGAGAILIGNCDIGDGCIIGAGAVLDASAAAGAIVLEPGSHVLAAATIAVPATIGRGARVQPGTVVMRDVPPHAIVSGNPAEITGYTTSSDATLPATAANPASDIGRFATRVRGVTFHRLPKILDLRGNLVVGEFGRSLPFQAKRFFTVFGVPNAEIRGEHAHRICKQFLICAHGSCHVVADDGKTREEFRLDDPSLGLYLPEMTWGIQYKYSHDAVLLVFASEFYDPAEYIRNYAEFLALSAGKA